VFYLALSFAKIIVLLCVNEIFTYMESGGMTVTGDNINSRRTASPNAMLFTTNQKLTGLGLNQTSTVRGRRLTS
jgi:hypothetical protein